MASRDHLAVALIGPGNVGSAVLEQLKAVQPRGIELRAVCDSRRMALGEPDLDLGGWRGALDGRGRERDLGILTERLADSQGTVAVVDTTASPEVAAWHATWLRRGFAVVTANKLACAAPCSAYQELREAERSGRGRYLYETTVGAGLPVIGVVRDFVATGDEVLGVEGVLSGTLSHLTTALMRGERFSKTVRRLHAEGFTEPDPRVDLGGADVARKLLILARAAGATLAPEDVAVTGFLSERVDDGDSVAAFLAGLERYDAPLAERCARTRADGRVLCYVARLDPGGKARVGLAAYAEDHPFARLTPGDNLIRVTTRRYQASPLVIQGPGAGREVTAAGILADLLRL